MRKMRVAIREQLAALVTFAVLVALAIVSIPTWLYVNRFVIDVTLEELSLTASLKSSRISAELELIQTSCLTISSRLLIQASLNTFYNGNISDSIWDVSKEDIKSALSAGVFTGLLQARIYSRNTTGNKFGLLNVTGDQIPDIALPYLGANGRPLLLSNKSDGYPPELYPNITYEDQNRTNPYRPNTQAFAANAFPDVRLATNGGLLLGPLVVNTSFALLSITIPIRDNQQRDFILGYMTVVAMANSLVGIQSSREGLGDTGIVLLVGPTSQSNRFNSTNPASNSTFKPDKDKFGNTLVKYLLPANKIEGHSDRHSGRSYGNGSDSTPFPLKEYPAALSSFAEQFNTINNASALLSTTNEQGARVAVGFARTQTALVNWTVIIEMDESEAYAPISTLSNILLGCVFGTAGLVLILIWPCAHLSVMPIRRLKAATEKTVHPPGYNESFYDGVFDDEETPGSGAQSQKSKRSGIWNKLLVLVGSRPKPRTASEHDREAARRTFKIPGKVAVRKHLVTDELTELTQTFNDMSDELVKQYTSLDEKVAERTRELELSKKAAEAANESKTLFIANISHELKTPLNGILGMCAVCMEENDILRIKQSLKTLYKSGMLD
jgi:osomolarity two-component system, sensor histidine kinase SLN1